MATNHVFFHNDIDGIISASLYLYYHKGEKCRLYPVTSEMRGEKFNAFFTQIVKMKDDKKIILDYQCHLDADLWVDHHFDPAFGENFIISTKFCYSPKAKSAASIMSFLSMDPIINEFSELIKDVDMIDSAGYKSVSQIFKDTSPIMILRAYLESIDPNDMIYCRIVEMIASCNMNIKEAIYLLRINSYYVKDLTRSAMKIKGSMVISKWVSVTNQRRKNQFPRYAEYLVCPQVKYAIRITNLPNHQVNIDVGYNKWHELKNEINIGKLIKFDYVKVGGGHFNVGGCIISEDLVNRFIDDISKALNEEEIEMEKYAVDQTDPVEKIAKELVKTADISITAARSLASAIEPATKVEEKDGATEQ